MCVAIQGVLILIANIPQRDGGSFVRNIFTKNSVISDAALELNHVLLVLRSCRPSHPNIVKLLTELRVLLLHRYGAKGVDFGKP